MSRGPVGTQPGARYSLAADLALELWLRAVRFQPLQADRDGLRMEFLGPPAAC